MNRRLLVIFTFVWAVGCILACSLAAQDKPYQVGVSPLRVDIKMPTGQVHTETIRVTSDGDEPVHMRVSAGDWFFNENDSPQHVAAGKHPSYSCGSWIRLNPTEFDIPPHGWTPVRFTVATPPGQAVGGYHCAVLVTTVPPPQTRQPATSVRTLIRFATTVYVVIGDPQPQAELVSLDMLPVAPDSASPPGTAEKPRWQYLLTLKNTGQTHFRVTATLEMTNQEGKTVNQFKVESQVILPESQRTFKFTSAEELVPGDYILTATIDIGLKTLLQGEKKVLIEANAVPPSPSPAR